MVFDRSINLCNNVLLDTLSPRKAFTEFHWMRFFFFKSASQPHPTLWPMILLYHTAMNLENYYKATPVCWSPDTSWRSLHLFSSCVWCRLGCAHLRDISPRGTPNGTFIENTASWTQQIPGNWSDNASNNVKSPLGQMHSQCWKHYILTSHKPGGTGRNLLQNIGSHLHYGDTEHVILNILNL